VASRSEDSKLIIRVIDFNLVQPILPEITGVVSGNMIYVDIRWNSGGGLA